MTPRRLLVARLIAPLAFVLVLAAAGCKQGIGDRCEQNDDCASGMCTAMSVTAGGGTGRCVEVGSSVTGAGGTGGTGGTGGAAGSDASAGDGQADGTSSGADAEDAPPGSDAASDAVATD